MLFASTELAARLERAECRLVVQGTEATGARRGDLDVLVRPLAGGFATLSVDGSPLNKVVGLGFGGPVDEGELADVEAIYAARGLPVQVELSNLAEPSIGAMLTGRGYVLRGFENVLGRPLAAGLDAEPVEGVEVRQGTSADSETWLDVVVTGFATPDSQGVVSHEEFPREMIEEVMRDMAAFEGFARFVASRDGRPAGGGSMRIDDGVAQLCGASTVPEHRRRGVQTALLSTRLALASAAGCDIATMTTQPGSKSQQNGHRNGFDLLYTRAVLVREPK